MRNELPNGNSEVDLVGMWLVCGQYVVSMWSVCGWYVVGRDGCHYIWSVMKEMWSVRMRLVGSVCFGRAFPFSSCLFNALSEYWLFQHGQYVFIEVRCVVGKPDQLVHYCPAQHTSSNDTNLWSDLFRSSACLCRSYSALSFCCCRCSSCCLSAFSCKKETHCWPCY